MSSTIHAPADFDGKAGFKTDLDVRLQDNGLWVLLSDLVWQGTDGDVLVVRAGEETDFASVPRLAQVLLPSADPRVIRAAVVHDFLCRELNDYHRAHAAWLMDEACGHPTAPPRKPAFSSVDADAIFKKIMGDDGAGWWMQNVGWLGVRYGAAVSPARRPGSLSTLPRVAGLSMLFLCLALVLVAIVVGLAIWAGPW